jgi:hypothetical protein
MSAGMEPRFVGRARGRSETLVLVSILAIGAALRLYGLNWDGGHWLHPDERQIYFVTLGLGWPGSLAEALSPESPLNPHFFAYGSLPFYLLKAVTAVASLLCGPWSPCALQDPDNLHLIGRLLAVLFDLGTVYLTYRLVRVSWPAPDHGGTSSWGEPGRVVGLFAAAVVSLAGIHVQLAHFYTTDPLLTCLVMLTLNLAVDVGRGGGKWRQMALGVAFGLALATKVNAALLLLVVFVAYGERQRAMVAQGEGLNAQFLAILRRMAPIVALAAVVFVVVQPYALIDWQTFVEDTMRESQIAWGSLDVPYTRQYAGTLPFVYSIWQTATWGVGLPLGLIIWASFVAVLIHWLRRGDWHDTVLLAWAAPYLVVTGLLYTRYLRYMLPLVPVLAILAVRTVAGLPRLRLWRLGVGAIALGLLLYTLVFSTLYAVPHSWIAASAWIYGNIPAGSTLAVEEWDTPLPLGIVMDGQARRSEEYNLRTLPLYREPDDEAKWRELVAALADSDYIIVASRRLYGSIPRLPERYPLATKYYEQLFGGELGFVLDGEFTRGVGASSRLLNPRLPPLPAAAPAPLHPDESFVVYDHPRALIFRNARHLAADELLRRLR